MGPLVVVILHVPLDPLKKLVTIIRRVQIHVFSFQGPPKAFYPFIIQATAASIHADLNFMSFKKFNPGLTGELRTLVGVDYFGFPVSGNGLTEDFQTVFTIQRIRKAPTHNLTAINVNNSREIHKSPAHGDISYVNRPNLI